MAVPAALYGERGQRPVVFAVAGDRWQYANVLAIPGVEWRRGRISCTWDVAHLVANLLGTTLPQTPDDFSPALPGLERYRELGFHLKAREYQKSGAVYLASRSYALLKYPMRTGKTLCAIMADVLIGSARTLVAAPSLAKWVWAEEFETWCNEGAAILHGRGGRQIRIYCTTCSGRAVLKNDDGSVSKCSNCKLRNGQSYGYKAYVVERLRRLVTHTTAHGAQYCSVPPLYCCPRHRDVVSTDKKRLCRVCREELINALKKSRYIITNYDILVMQEDAGGSGERVVRFDLPGWAAVLAHVSVDVAILDESHRLRGRPKVERRGKSRRDRLRFALRGVPRVWLLTGTPIFGYTRDLFSQHWIASDGLWGENHFDWDTRYCEGHRGVYGWEADGRSTLAETELVARLPWWILSKTRKDLLGQVPGKTRQVIRIDPGDVNTAARKLPKALPVWAAAPGEDRFMQIKRGLRMTWAYKIDALIENVTQGLAEGNKEIVFCFLKESAVSTCMELEKALTSRTRASRMREVNATVFLAHGDVADKARVDLARRYREHQGAAVIVCTVHSMTEAISLKGACIEHFIECTWSPAEMEQAEDRPFAVDSDGLHIMYYAVTGSLDEHVLNTILPKYDTQKKIVGSEEADNVTTAFKGTEAYSGKTEEEIIEEAFARLTAHLAPQTGRSPE